MEDSPGPVTILLIRFKQVTRMHWPNSSPGLQRTAAKSRFHARRACRPHFTAHRPRSRSLPVPAWTGSNRLAEPGPVYGHRRADHAAHPAPIRTASRARENGDPEQPDKPGYAETVPWEEILAVDEALRRLGELDPQQARIAEMRYFGGLSVEETAEALGVSPRTVKRDWAVAKGLVANAALRRTAGMTAERWALISGVFREALDRPAAERTAYLDEACRGDELLRRSVERLLAGEAEPSLDSPAVKLLDAGAAGLAPGDTLAQYLVEAAIGEGGMGAVYRAHDTRLHRKVALKVLRPEAFGDPGRLARLMREARSASALNHPNIVTIYEIGSDRGVDFIALEFVPGETLARLLGRKGLPLRDALKYAAQIAAAVAAAHRAGIVHRDLKPANIVITPAGQVKVLDFGLAKGTGPAACEEPGSTATMGPSTDTGAILGTPAYMSPEQAEGKTLDARSDIFSFGVVLYEMVTGKRAFERDSTAATLAALLKEEPRLAGALVPGLPLELDKILARCLRKDPERRFQHMDDLGVELNELRETLNSGVPESPATARPGRSRKLPWIAGLALVVAAAGAMAWRMRFRTSALEETAVPVPLTSYPGTEGTPSFSPDGTQVAFAWCKDAQENRCNIYIKQIGVEPPFRVTGNPAPEFSPAWSPDGRLIAFLRRLDGEKTALNLIPQRGGRERVLSEFDLSPPDSLEGRTWRGLRMPNGLQFPQREGRLCGLFLVSVETGEKRKLTQPAGDSRGYEWRHCPRIFAGRPHTGVRAAIVEVRPLSLAVGRRLCRSRGAGQGPLG